MKGRRDIQIYPVTSRWVSSHKQRSVSSWEWQCDRRCSGKWKKEGMDTHTHGVIHTFTHCCSKTKMKEKKTYLHLHSPLILIASLLRADNSELIYFINRSCWACRRCAELLLAANSEHKISAGNEKMNDSEDIDTSLTRTRPRTSSAERWRSCVIWFVKWNDLFLFNAILHIISHTQYKTATRLYEPLRLAANMLVVLSPLLFNHSFCI